MANKGNSRHMKRIAAPRYQKIGRKAAKYIVKPRAGRHSLEKSISLVSLLRDKLGYARNAMEARKILNKGAVEANGKVISDPAYAIGMGDIVKLVPTNESFAVVIGKHGNIEIEKAKGSSRTLKVTRRYLFKKGKDMIMTHSGENFENKGAKVNDSVVIENGKVSKVLPFKVGAECLIESGEHATEKGTIEEIRKGSSRRKMEVMVKTASGQINTIVDNIIVTG